MIELLRTNDPVLISFVESLMRDAGIGFFVADQNMSIVEGSLGILPRRVMVEKDREARFRNADEVLGFLSRKFDEPPAGAADTTQPIPHLNS